MTGSGEAVLNALLPTLWRVAGISHPATEKPTYISRQNSPIATPAQDGVGWAIIRTTPPSAKAAAAMRGRLKFVATMAGLIRPITYW